MKVSQLFESLDFPTYVMGEHHCFLVKDRVNNVQKALRAYGGSFVLAQEQDWEATPPENRREFNSLSQFMQFLQQTHKTDQERGYNVPDQFNDNNPDAAQNIINNNANVDRRKSGERRSGFTRRANDRRS